MSPIKGLSSDFQLSDTGLHSIYQGISLMFADRDKTEILQPIIRLDSVKMMYDMPFRNFTIGIHPNHTMFQDIAITPRKNMTRRINHNIPSRREVAPAFPVRVVFTCSQCHSAFSTKYRYWRFGFPALWADMVRMIWLPTAISASRISLSNWLTTHRALFCKTSIFCAIRTQNFMSYCRHKFLAASSTDCYCFSLTHSLTSPIVGLYTILSFLCPYVSKTKGGLLCVL